MNILNLFGPRILRLPGGPGVHCGSPLGFRILRPSGAAGERGQDLRITKDIRGRHRRVLQPGNNDFEFALLGIQANCDGCAPGTSASARKALEGHIDASVPTPASL